MDYRWPGRIPDRRGMGQQ